jgi:NAD(P)-dependent dehydrogenase (short-subunit alcohol dehydrogenase family)
MQALALADAVRAQAPGPDILINNAARTAAIWQASVDLVLASAVNYLAGYLLTRKLLPLLMGRLS